MATKANGLDGFDTEMKFNSPLHVKHLQNLVDLQKDKTYDYSGRDSEERRPLHLRRMPDLADLLGLLRQRQGEREVRLHRRCRCRTTRTSRALRRTRSSAALRCGSWAARRRTSTRASRSSSPSCPTPTVRPSCTRNRATCRSRRRPTRRPRRLASTRRTRSSRRRCKELTNKEPTENSRGLRFGNMVQIRDVVVGGDRGGARRPEGAKDALDTAVQPRQPDPAPVRAHRAQADAGPDALHPGRLLAARDDLIEPADRCAVTAPSPDSSRDGKTRSFFRQGAALRCCSVPQLAIT